MSQVAQTSPASPRPTATYDALQAPRRRIVAGLDLPPTGGVERTPSPRQRGEERLGPGVGGGGEEVGGVRELDHEAHGRALRHDPDGHVVAWPHTDTVDHQVDVGQRQGHAVRPGIAASLVVPHGAGKPAKRTGCGHEAGVVDAPGLDPHDQ